MGCWLIPAIIGLLAYSNIIIVRLFNPRLTGPRWWVALVVAWLVGGALGVWSGFFFEYQVSPTLRVAGAPVPAAFFHWEGPPGEERWIDFITPAPVLFAGSNIVILAMLLPWWVATLFLICRGDLRDQKS